MYIYLLAFFLRCVLFYGIFLLGFYKLLTLDNDVSEWPLPLLCLYAHTISPIFFFFHFQPKLKRLSRVNRQLSYANGLCLIDELLSFFLFRFLVIRITNSPFLFRTRAATWALNLWTWTLSPSTSRTNVITLQNVYDSDCLVAQLALDRRIKLPGKYER